MLRSSFTSQFRWAALHYGHLDISYLAVVRFAGTSIEKEREKEGVRRRSEKIRVVFEQVSLPSSNPDHYSTPGAIEQPATWLIVSQTILSNVCEPAMNSRHGNIYTCIPFITPYRNRSSKIANCIQSVPRNSPIDRLSFFQKEFSYTLHSEMILFILDKSLNIFLK